MSRKTLSLENNPLFGGPSLAERGRSGSPFRFLPIADIDVDPDQPRRVFEEEALGQLAASIKEYGVLCPILVRITAGGTFRLVSGERRLRASKLAGLQEIPAVVDREEEQESDVLAKQLVENIQREDLNPLERALGVGHLREKYALSIREIAQKLGVSKALVQRSLEILALPDDLQAALIAGASESKVLLLAQIEDRQQRKELLEQLDQLTRVQLEQSIQAIKGGGEAVYRGGTVNRQNQVKTAPEDERIARELEQALRTKVKIERRRGDAEKGKLVVEFYSNQDLAEIYSRLVS